MAKPTGSCHNAPKFSQVARLLAVGVAVIDTAARARPDSIAALASAAFSSERARSHLSAPNNAGDIIGARGLPNGGPEAADNSSPAASPSASPAASAARQ